MALDGSVSSLRNFKLSGYINPHWLRRGIDLSDSFENQSVIFQLIDLDYYQGQANFNFTDLQGLVPIIRLFGVTMAGNSVMCHVHGFLPYFYVPAPPKFNAASCTTFKRHLNQAILADKKFNYSNFYAQPVFNIELVEKQNIYGFRGDEKKTFMKITVLLPVYIPAVRKILQSTRLPLSKTPYELFEANIDFEIRFMVDTEMVGCCWLELPANLFLLRSRRENNTPGCLKASSRCQIEIDINWRDLIIHPPEGEWLKVAPFRILSFDIECAGRKGIFPEPDKDPVIQIASVVQIQNENQPFIKNVFTLNTCAAIDGTEILSYENERQLLQEWANFVRVLDPDIITGYNIQNFDFSYLIKRAEQLNVATFPFLGRMNHVRTNIEEFSLQSKQMGFRQYKRIGIAGRVQFDILQILLRDYKLRSYTLNAVSSHFLQEQKEDVHHSVIPELQNGDDQTRRRLAVYCLKDASLPLHLLEKLMCFVNYMEMARVTGVPLTYLLNRGQQIKIVSQILRQSAKRGFLIPTIQVDPKDKFTGATVIEPLTGYYDSPVATLDFSSLYPSIMMAHNLCYTTFLIPDLKDKFNFLPDQYTVTPSSDCFVKSTVRKGLLPEILENLLIARQKAKNELKNETDPFKRNVLDGRQLALKISANSVYGFTGAQLGKLPCLEISRSVTSFGRTMIEQAKRLAEEKYTLSNGYTANARVIYGDTDSIMINFGVSDLSEVIRLGREAADHISAAFIYPIKLEFEKIYFPYLLLNKKKYAGLCYTRPEEYDKMECKGIETVRRDNCLLVSDLIKICLQKILIERNPSGAIEIVQETVENLLGNRVDISQLVISKELRKTAEQYKVKQAHVELARRMMIRDPGSAPNLGDRVPYVITASIKKWPAYLKAEDPIYVLENNIPIDTEYYLYNQLSKPLLRIFEPILGTNAESVLLGGKHTRTKTVATKNITRPA